MYILEKRKNCQITLLDFRAEWIDVARGVGILVMLVNHTAVGFYARRIMSGFNMPFFFILSGYLFKLSNERFRDFVIKKWKLYIVPYFKWGLICVFINIPLDIKAGVLHDKNIFENIIGYIWGLIYGRTQFMPRCGPLWFLPCIFLTCIIFWLLIKYVKNFAVQFSISLMGIVLPILMNYYNILGLPWHLDTALYAILFMLFGYYMKEIDLLSYMNFYVCLIFAFVGSYASIINVSTLDMNNRVMANPFISYVGAILFSTAMLWMCKTFL